MSRSETRTATLEFDRRQLAVASGADLRQGLSAVVAHERQLWLACDEGCRLERLARSSSALHFRDHHVFPLDGLLRLPAGPEEEADIEGLDIDDGWLWLIGSHSVKRKKPGKGDSPDKAATKLKTTARDGNRHLLARIPLHDGGLAKKAGGRRAAAIAASPKSSALLDAILEHEDPHFLPFVNLPGKDNGFDIEGLAVRGRRVFAGLRGPVLREWCCILELDLEGDGKQLQLRPIDGDRPYRKHFQKLSGLGIRDLAVLEHDLFALVGPTMAHDGPSEIWRWKNGARTNAGSSMPDFKRLLVLPQREGADRPEGFTFLTDSGPTSILVVFDTPASSRLKNTRSVLADVYRLR
jgi:hypothetical protein